jgi:hypothetical protein
VRDLLYLNQGRDAHGRTTFREVGELARVDAGEPDHGLGAVLSDLDGDGRLDVYVANDLDPNQLYRNVRWPGGATADPLGLGFRLRDVAAQEGVADPNAGMGIAVADYDGNGLSDVFVSNARGQDHAVYRARRAVGGPAFAEVSADFASAFGNSFTGWGASWVDLDLDTDLDFVLANGDIPVASLAEDAEPIQVIENVAASGTTPRFAMSGAAPTRPTRCGSMGVASRRPTTTTTATSTSPLTRSAARSCCSRTRRGRPLARGRAQRVRPWSPVKLTLSDGRTFVREVRPAAATSPRKIRASISGSGNATEVRALVIRYPDGTRIRLADLEADQVVTSPGP